MTEQPTETIDLQALHEAQSPALTRLIHVPTPEQQLDEVLNAPNVSPADAAFAKTWAKNEQQRREGFGREWIKDSRAGIKDRAKALSDAIHEDTQEANRLYDRARQGDFDSSEELFTVGAQIRERIVRYDRAIASIEATEETIDTVETDPESYFYDFYSRYGSLAERLPTLTDALTERHSR